MDIKDKIKNGEIKYAGIIFDDVANGDGVGAVFFTQGCPHQCKGCHNPNTWDENGGMFLENNELNYLFKYFEDVPFASRLTISGGDPLSKHNLDLTEYIIKEFKKRFPNKKIWLYTGYNYDDILMDYTVTEEYHRNTKQRFNIVKNCDFIVDRKFKINKRDVSLKFRGSSNQRIIDIQKSLETGTVVQIY